MIKVILNGCNGRMGKVLTSLIGGMDDMSVVAGVDVNTQPVDGYPVFASLAECPVMADVLLDFSNPKTLSVLLLEAVKRNLPVVIATTGLATGELELVEKSSRKIPIFRSANMSLGINLLQNLVQSATKVLGERYDVEIVEKHHKLKKDSPSGTALMLADSINEVRLEQLRLVHGREGRECLRQPDELGMHSLRGGTIVGEHDVYFTGTDELIQLGHKAHSRQVFATGAIAAAKYLINRKPGLYNMQDMINEASAVTTVYTFPHELLVTLDKFPRDMQAIADLYGDFASADIFIDMISHSGHTSDQLSISFTINSSDLKGANVVLDGIRAKYPTVQTWVEENITKITVEGAGMEFQSGVAYRVFSCMAKAGIYIMAVTTSEIKISFITRASEVEKAVGIIRAEFGI
jgi:4-hydroxy-tetrahydrodipicolinate reductase